MRDSDVDNVIITKGMHNLPVKTWQNRLARRQGSFVRVFSSLIRVKQEMLYVNTSKFSAKV